MNDHSEYRPRLSITISEEQYQKKKRLIPWGLEGHLIRKVLDQTLDLIEQEGSVVIAAIIQDKLTVSDYLKEGKHGHNVDEEVHKRDDGRGDTGAYKGPTTFSTDAKGKP